MAKTMRKTRKNVGNRADISSQIQRYLRRHAERKFFQVTTSFLVDITWDVTAISQGIIQGITGAQRIGDNIRYNAVTVMGRVTINPIPSAIGTNIRMVLVLDKMNVGVAPVYSDLFISNTLDSTCDVEQIKEKRFTILMDESHNLTLGGISTWMFNRKINMNQTAMYNGATSTTAANGKNSMWMFIAGDDGSKPSCNVNFQLEFSDI